MSMVTGPRIALLMSILLVTVPLRTIGQSDQPDRVYRIGFLAFGPRPVSTAVTSPLVSFRQTLRERGYVEGENLTIDERWAEARLNRLPVLAAELIKLKPDIIVASGAGAVRAAMRETEEIPIVIAGAADPVAEGLVTSLAHPEANVTGVSVLAGRRLEGKRLQLLRQAIPGVKRVAVILDSTSRLDPTPLQNAAHESG